MTIVSAFDLKYMWYTRLDEHLHQVKLYTPHGSIKYQTDCAPNTGYYLIPLYDKGDYILKAEPPKGWGFGKSCFSCKIFIAIHVEFLVSHLISFLYS